MFLYFDLYLFEVQVRFLFLRKIVKGGGGWPSVRGTYCFMHADKIVESVSDIWKRKSRCTAAQLFFPAYSKCSKEGGGGGQNAQGGQKPGRWQEAKNLHEHTLRNMCFIILKVKNNVIMCRIVKLIFPTSASKSYLEAC